MKAIVLYGIGSPLVVDAEESCARAAIDIVAGIRNVEARDWVSEAVRVVAAADVDDALRRHPIVVALFTPGHRRRAFHRTGTGRRSIHAWRFCSSDWRRCHPPAGHYTTLCCRCADKTGRALTGETRYGLRRQLLQTNPPYHLIRLVKE